jgi:hypothetical protein
MVKVRTLLGIAIALTMGVAQAAPVVQTDFTKNSTGWTINGTAQLLDPKTAGVTQVLSLTQNTGNQTGTAWTEARQKPASFSMIVDMRIRHEKVDPDGNEVNECPADGVVFGFAPVDADFVGGGGGSISLFSGEVETFTSVVVNTWRGAGNGNEDERGSCTTNTKYETFEFGVVTPSYGDFTRPQDGVVRTVDEGGSKINQVNPPAGMKIVNGGFYRYQWDVDSADNTMALYVTGLDDSNKQFQKVKVIEAKFDPAKVKLLDFEGRWGMAAATGGAVQYTDIRSAEVHVPKL